MRKLIACAILCLLFGGCLTTKKREDIAHRYLRENPRVVEELSRLYFPVKPSKGVPVIDTFRADTFIRFYEGRAIEVSTSETVRIDTIEKRILKYIKETITDTVVDISLVSSLQRENLLMSNRVDSLFVVSSKKSNRSENRLYWIIGLAFYSALSTVLVIAVTLKR